MAGSVPEGGPDAQLRLGLHDGSVVVMARATLSGRVEVLEQTVTGLAALPDRVGALEQSLANFRKETQREFAAVRKELRDVDEETRRHMLMLHEDLIARISAIGEGIDDLRGR
jgi:hypothetical protein